MQRKEHRQDCPPTAGRPSCGGQAGRRPKTRAQRASQRRPPEGGRYRINGRGNRGDGTAALRKSEAHRRDCPPRRAGPPAAGSRVPPSQRRLRRRCGRPSEMGSSPSIPRSGTGSQDELLPRCGSNSQAAPLPKLSVRRERWCGIDQFVSAFVRRRDKRTVSLYFAYYF
jgi:hypothetical protein